jgi:hypothetical protein
MKSNILLICIFFLLIAAEAPGYQGACPALPSPSGNTVTVDSEQTLWDAVNAAQPGTTILIADGTYDLAGSGYYLWIDTPGVTVRSLSGNRESVILDDNYSGSEIITIAASNVTIAELTLMRARTHPIHVVSTDSADTLNTRIYNVHIIDPGQQAIKINPHSAKVHFTDDGEVACSTLELTDQGRVRVWDINGSCYTGGVDGHQSRGWVVRDNTIKGFWCPQGLSEHGVHFWTGSRDTLVERNTFIDNARGIGFGLRESGTGRTYGDAPCPDAQGFVGHYGGIIRNNFIFASDAQLFASQYGADGGIALAQACGPQVLHNTVCFTQPPFAAIEWRFANTEAGLTNNLVTHNLMDRGGSANLSGNLSQQPLSLFVDGAHGDLHLDSGAAAAVDQGVGVAAGLCGDDFDGHPRPAGAGRDIGADERAEAATNTTPIAHSQHLTVDADSTANPISLSATDADQDPLQFTVTTHPLHGTLQGTAPNMAYTPAAGYTGTDSFFFSVNDGTLDSDRAVVTIVVEATDSGGGDTGDNSDSGSNGGCFISQTWGDGYADN